MITVVLRGEPEGKGRPRFRVASSRSGKSFVAVYTPKQTRTYESALKLAGRVAMGRREILDGPITVTIAAIMTVPRSWSQKKRDAALAGVVRPTGTPDLDNIMKMLDGLNGTVWIDDKQIVDAKISKRYGEEPMLRVEVKPVGAFEAER